MADPEPADVTDAELAVLEVLWARGSATRRQIADELYPGGGPAHYTTVQKLLERLEAKGYVAANRSQPVRTFAAAVRRDQLIQLRLRGVAEKLCGGSLTPLLMNLVRAKPLSAVELKELQALIRDLGRTRPKPDGGR
jgi:BlaI family transcriptional regulator, penicillinase repressor